jgi:integrase
MSRGCAPLGPPGLISPLGSADPSILSFLNIEKAMKDIANGRTATDAKTARGRSIVTGGRGAATQTVRLLSAMLSFAIRRGLRTDNPASQVAKFPTRKNERFLSSAELEALGTAIREAETRGTQWEPSPTKKYKHAPKPENRRVRISPFAAAALRLLIFTGARLREILTLKWEHVDLERGVLALPDSKTGPKVIILNRHAKFVLERLPRSST